MNLSNFIAKRYLFAKKSHNVINLISIISAAGIAIGCASLVIILSIYNGFDDLVKQLYNSTTADLQISSSKGKSFDAKVLAQLRSNESIASYNEILEENIFLIYGNKHSVVTARGVDSLYEKAVSLDNYIVDGKFAMYEGKSARMVLGYGVAGMLSANIKFLTPLQAMYPANADTVDFSNPMGMLKSRILFPSGIISIDDNFDSRYVFMPLNILQDLTGRKTVSSVELRLKPEYISSDGAVKSAYQKNLSKQLGDDFIVKNSYQQNESLYKVLTYEKMAVYAILIFVMLIISCNALGSLSMLIIDKSDDIEILRSMGATASTVKRIFRLEGWMISMFGTIIGIVIGLVICYIQTKYGIVKLPGNFVVDAYPVKVLWTDMVLIFTAVAAIGGLMAYLPTKNGIK